MCRVATMLLQGHAQLAMMPYKGLLLLRFNLKLSNRRTIPFQFARPGCLLWIERYRHSATIRRVITEQIKAVLEGRFEGREGVGTGFRSRKQSKGRGTGGSTGGAVLLTCVLQILLHILLNCIHLQGTMCSITLWYRKTAFLIPA